ncbi:hypothetical protein RJ640_029603 [Escallonia rubra]|uniref:Uncharacterized protein n=1 Tax=Escallonia rubra TaxID=112253 RepID=A0AA88UVN3_9ASTE|nr:hypothetical protein RJ640_029603 [Escallonia rubra]
MQSQDSSIKVERIFDFFEDSDHIIDNVESFFDRFRVAVSCGLPDLIERQNSLGCPVKIVVYDSTMPWVLDIAHQLGLYGAVFHTQSCAVGTVYYHMHKGSLKIDPTEGSTVSLPSMPLMETKDLSSFIYDAGSYPSTLRLVLNQFSNWEKADWRLFNTFDKLEGEVVNWMASQWPIKTIGPTIPSMYLDKRLEDDKDYGLSLFKRGDEDCIKWLDTKKTGSVVYVSFGSLANLGEDQMEEIACGLKQSNRYFLWVVRASEESKLPTNFATEASEKGRVVNWCPQLKVLAHPATGWFMTHCGWNSTMEALSLGVPMLAVPQWTDQPTNAKYIVDVWQVGVRVNVDEKGMITRDEIEFWMREVMEGERGNELKRNAVRWKEFAKEAVGEGGCSDKHIDEFISELHINPMVRFSKRLASKGLEVTLVATTKSMQPQDSSIKIEHISDCFGEGVVEGEKMERQAVATSSQTHVLVFPFIAQGHINPMVQFSKGLASKGLKVTLVATHKSMQSQDSSIKVERISDFFEESDHMINNVESFFDRLRVAVSRGLPDLIEKQNSLGCPVKIVVYDSTMPWILDIAHQLGLYGAVFHTQSCAVGAVYYHMHKGSLKIDPAEGSTLSLPSMPLMETKDLSSFIYDMGSYPSTLRLVLNQFSNWEKANWCLFNTFDKLEGEVVNWMASQ